MTPPERIEPDQLFCLAALLTVASTIFILPGEAIEAGGRSAWVVAVGAGAVNLVAGMIIGGLSQRFPADTAVSYARRIAGPVVGWIIGLVIALAFVGAVVDHLATIAHTVSSGLLVFTPTPVVAMVGVLVAGYWAWTGWERIGRLSPLVLAGLLATTAAAAGLLAGVADWGYLRPWFDWGQLRPQSHEFWLGLVDIHSPFALAMLIPHTVRPAGATRTFLAGTGVGWLVVAFYTVVPVAVLGSDAARAVSHPFPDVLGTLSLFRSPFARPEFIATVMYQIYTLAALAAFLWLAGRAFAQLAGRTDPRPFVVIATVAAAALVGMTTVLGEAARQVGEMLDVALYGLVPLYGLLWILYWLRGLGRRT